MMNARAAYPYSGPVNDDDDDDDIDDLDDIKELIRQNEANKTMQHDGDSFMPNFPMLDLVPSLHTPSSDFDSSSFRQPRNADTFTLPLKDVSDRDIGAILTTSSSMPYQRAPPVNANENSTTSRSNYQPRPHTHQYGATSSSVAPSTSSSYTSDRERDRLVNRHRAQHKPVSVTSWSPIIPDEDLANPSLRALAKPRDRTDLLVPQDLPPQQLFNSHQLMKGVHDNHSRYRQSSFGHSENGSTSDQHLPTTGFRLQSTYNIPPTSSSRPSTLYSSASGTNSYGSNGHGNGSSKSRHSDNKSSYRYFNPKYASDKRPSPGPRSHSRSHSHSSSHQYSSRPHTSWTSDTAADTPMDTSETPLTSDWSSGESTTVRPSTSGAQKDNSSASSSSFVHKPAPLETPRVSDVLNKIPRIPKKTLSADPEGIDQMDEEELRSRRRGITDSLAKLESTLDRLQTEKSNMEKESRNSGIPCGNNPRYRTCCERLSTTNVDIRSNKRKLDLVWEAIENKQKNGDAMHLSSTSPELSRSKPSEVASIPRRTEPPTPPSKTTVSADATSPFIGTGSKQDQPAAEPVDDAPSSKEPVTKSVQAKKQQLQKDKQRQLIERRELKQKKKAEGQRKYPSSMEAKKADMLKHYKISRTSDRETQDTNEPIASTSSASLPRKPIRTVQKSGASNPPKRVTIQTSSNKIHKTRSDTDTDDEDKPFPNLELRVHGNLHVKILKSKKLFQTPMIKLPKLDINEYKHMLTEACALARLNTQGSLFNTIVKREPFDWTKTTAQYFDGTGDLIPITLNSDGEEEDDEINRPIRVQIKREKPETPRQTSVIKGKLFSDDEEERDKVETNFDKLLADVESTEKQSTSTNDDNRKEHNAKEANDGTSNQQDDSEISDLEDMPTDQMEIETNNDDDGVDDDQVDVPTSVASTRAWPDFTIIPNHKPLAGTSTKINADERRLVTLNSSAIHDDSNDLSTPPIISSAVILAKSISNAVSAASSSGITSSSPILANDDEIESETDNELLPASQSPKLIIAASGAEDDDTNSSVSVDHHHHHRAPDLPNFQTPNLSDLSDPLVHPFHDAVD